MYFLSPFHLICFVLFSFPVLVWKFSSIGHHAGILTLFQLFPIGVFSLILIGVCSLILDNKYSLKLLLARKPAGVHCGLLFYVT